MTDIIELVRERKWDTLLMVLLLIALIAIIPVTVRATINTQFEENLEPIKNSIEMLEEIQMSEIVDRGIAAYKKVQTVDQLETSTQNGASIKIALKFPEARSILFAIDRERTLLFEEYFCQE